MKSNGMKFAYAYEGGDVHISGKQFIIIINTLLMVFFVITNKIWSV